MNFLMNWLEKDDSAVKFKIIDYKYYEDFEEIIDFDALFLNFSNV